MTTTPSYIRCESAPPAANISFVESTVASAIIAHSTTSSLTSVGLGSGSSSTIASTPSIISSNEKDTHRWQRGGADRDKIDGTQRLETLNKKHELLPTTKKKSKKSAAVVVEVEVETEEENNSSQMRYQGVHK